jgi:hypothetical protein
MGTKLVQFKVETYPKMRVIGKGVSLIEGGMSLEDHSIEDLWASMAQDGSLEVLALTRSSGTAGRYGGLDGRFSPARYAFHLPGGGAVRG